MAWPRWSEALNAAALSLALLSATSAGARAGQILLHQRAPSPALRRDLNYNLYEPAARPGDGAGWPVLYLLHGLGDTSSAWVKFGHIRSVMDRLIAQGRIPPMLVVMPGAGRSWYIDDRDPGGDLMEQAITHDLIADVDSRYKTLRCRQGRVIGGLSMGGYGSALYAMDRPRLFAAAFSLSGGFWRLKPAGELVSASLALDRFNVVFGHPLDPRRKNKWSLFSRIPAYAADPRRTPLWLSIGDHDYPRLRVSNFAFVKALSKAGVQVPIRTDPGAHVWGLWDKDISPALIWAAGFLRPAC